MTRPKNWNWFMFAQLYMFSMRSINSICYNKEAGMCYIVSNADQMCHHTAFGKNVVSWILFVILQKKWQCRHYAYFTYNRSLLKPMCCLYFNPIAASVCLCFHGHEIRMGPILSVSVSVSDVIPTLDIWDMSLSIVPIYNLQSDVYLDPLTLTPNKLIAEDVFLWRASPNLIKKNH